MKTLDVHIPADELKLIMEGKSNEVSFQMMPDNFHTICLIYVNGKHFPRIEDAFEIPEDAAWLEENDIVLEPVKFDTLRLFNADAQDEACAVELPVQEATISYLDDEDGNPVYTPINGIYYRDLMMNYSLRNNT